MKAVRQLETTEVRGAIHPRRRVVVLQCEDGLFTFAEEYQFVSEREVIAEGWHRLPTNGIYAIARSAEVGGSAAFPRWYSGVMNE